MRGRGAALPPNGSGVDAALRLARYARSRSPVGGNLAAIETG
jgi:hypothetical protein